MEIQMEKRIRSLHAGLREWKARIALAEESEAGLVGEPRRQLDYRMSVLCSAVERADAAPADEAEPHIIEAEEAWTELQEFWNRSLPDASTTMLRDDQEEP